MKKEVQQVDAEVQSIQLQLESVQVCKNVKDVADDSTRPRPTEDRPADNLLPEPVKKPASSVANQETAGKASPRKASSEAASAATPSTTVTTAATSLKDIIKYAAVGSCRTCGSSGRACARCHSEYYCGKEHQLEDWPRHKHGCNVLEVRAGRLVAVKNIPAGAVLLREQVAISYPRVDVLPGPGLLLCVGCCVRVDLRRRGGQCSGCGLPVCNEGDCDRDGQHGEECAQLQRAKFKLRRGEAAAYGSSSMAVSLTTPEVSIDKMALATLRVYNWLSRPAHAALGVRGSTEVPEALVPLWGAVRGWLLGKAGLSWLPEDQLRRSFLIARRFGSINVPIYMLVPSQSTKECRVMGTELLFVVDMLLLSSCRPNSFKSCHIKCESQELALLAARDLRRGEALLVDAGDPLQTPVERAHTSLATGRDMACEQTNRLLCICTDPTFGGLHLESWGCHHCPGLVVPLPFGKWDTTRNCCDRCGRAMSIDELRAARLPLEMEFRALVQSLTSRDGPDRWDDFLRRHLRPAGRLHAMHMVALRAKRNLAESMKFRTELFTDVVSAGQRPRPPHTTEELMRWETACRDVLRALDVLHPGYGLHRNRVLVHMVKLLAVRALQLHKEGTRGQELEKLLQEADGIMETQRTTLLTYEDRMMLCKVGSICTLVRSYIAQNNP